MGPQETQTPPGMGGPLPASMGFSAPATDTTLSEALITLRKRRWVLVLAVLLGLGYGYYKAVSQVKLYTSYGRIEVRSGSSNEFRVSASPYSYGSDSRMLTEIAIIQSDSLMLSVARDMNLANNAEFLGIKGTPPHRSLDDPDLRQQIVGGLQGGTHVSLVPKTDIIRIDYSSLSPKLSADIVNKIIEQYVKRSYETRFASTRRVSNWLSNQLDDLKQQVETSQEQLMDMQRKLGMNGFDPSRTQMSTTLDDLVAASGQARIARIIAESRYRMVAGMDPDTIAGSIEITPGIAPGQLGSLRGQLAGMKASYALQLSRLGPKNPTMVALQAQMDEITRAIDAEQSRLLIQSRETYLAARGTETQTKAALEQQKSDAFKLRDDMVQYSLQQREYESNRTLYEGLLQRLRTADVQAGLEALEIDVVDPAYPATSPTLQPASSIVITTTLFFLLGGIVIAFVLESLDTGLRSVAEIEAVTELPSLAIIPRARRGNAEQTANLTTAQRNINSLSQPKSQFAEAFRSLRTSLLLSTAGHPPKYILFTSATPSEGKTTTASNLACVLAQKDTRVLLIDGDLRRPNLHHRFGLNGKVGLSTLLAGTITLEDAAQPVPEVPNLDVLSSGPVPPFPTEMLGSETMQTLLRRAGELYDYVVIDSPPILSVTDGVILARLVDAVVLVVRHGKSSKHVVRRARDLLLRSGAPMTGIVLNAVDLNSPEYYGYYGYSGYSYSSLDAESWESQGVSGSKKNKGGRES